MKVLRRYEILTFILHLGVWNGYLATLATNSSVSSRSTFNRTYHFKKSSYQDWFDPVMARLSEEIASNLWIQTLIYDVSQLPLDELNYIYKRISNKTSNRIMDYKTMLEQPKHVTALEDHKLLAPGTKSTIELIFIRFNDNLNKFANSLYRIMMITTDWISSIPRPKTLIVIFGCNDNSSTQRKVAHLLEVFWTNFRIFDLTVICVFRDRRVSPKLISINPFKRYCRIQSIDKQTQLDPIFFENTFDMNRSALHADTPNIKSTYQEHNLYLGQYLYYMYKMKFGHLLFALKFICQVFKCDIVLGEASIDQRVDKNVDLFLNIRSVDSFHSFPFAKLHFPFNLKAAIPNEASTNEDYEKQELYIFLGFMLGTLVIFTLTARMFALPLPDWNLINIWLGLLGSSLNVRRNKLPEVVIHTTLGVVAFVTSNELVSMVTNFNFIGEEIFVDSCEKLEKFNVKILSKYDLNEFKLGDCFLNRPYPKKKQDASLIWPDLITASALQRKTISIRCICFLKLTNYLSKVPILFLHRATKQSHSIADLSG